MYITRTISSTEGNTCLSSVGYDVIQVAWYTDLAHILWISIRRQWRIFNFSGAAPAVPVFSLSLSLWQDRAKDHRGIHACQSTRLCWQCADGWLSESSFFFSLVVSVRANGAYNEHCSSCSLLFLFLFVQRKCFLRIFRFLLVMSRNRFSIFSLLLY